MENLNDLLEDYRALNTSPSIEEEKELLYRYVYATNKLEGNQLNLAQTMQLLSTDTITGSNVRTSDILEQKGMYKALVRMLTAVRNQEKLSVSLLLELNWKALGHLGNTTVERIDPLSTPTNVAENMENLIKSIDESDRPVVEKSAFSAQELWLYQPFVDGNKRTGRLAVNFLTMSAGFPLFVFEDKSKNYNSLLVEQYLEEKPDLVTAYIEKCLISTMKRYLKMDRNKGGNTGLRMML